MKLTNLSQNTIDVSLYCRVLTNDIFKDFRFVDLMNTLIKQVDRLNKYRFAIYSDSSHMNINIFIPIFHTIYIGSSNHNVLIFDSEDLWLIDQFPNNNYYIIKAPKDQFDYSKFNIKEINTIKEIL